MTSKRALDVKAKLKRGDVVYSAWLTFNDVGVAEVLAGSGFDVVLIDTEHTSITLENLHHCLAAMKAWDPVTIVRVPGLNVLRDGPSHLSPVVVLTAAVATLLALFALSRDPHGDGDDRA